MTKRCVGHFCCSGKARSRIRHFLKGLQQKESAALGEQLLEKALATLKVAPETISWERWESLQKEFGARSQLNVGDASYEIYKIDTVEGHDRLPFSLKVLLENLLRTEDGANITSDHIRALNRHAQTKRIFDFALINRTPAPPELKAKYALEGANQIVADLDAIEEIGVIPVLGDYLDQGMVARHRTDQIAADLMELVAQAPGGTRAATP